MENEIVLSQLQSEYDALVAEVQALKDEIAALSAERDDLELHICRELQAEYDFKIGGLELQITSLNLEIEKLRTVIENMQAAVNRGEKISREAAEEDADERLHHFYEDLKQKSSKIKKEQEYAKKRWEQDQENNRKEGYDPDFEGDFDWEAFFDFIKINISFGHGDGSDDKEEESEEAPKKKVSPNQEMKELYHKIVKALHPDMNPDATEQEKVLLDEAIKAYADGNLDRLREIAEIIDDKDISARFKDNSEDIAELKKLREQLIKQKEGLRINIENIKNSFPYNMVDFLSDEDAVAARQQELLQIIDSCNSTIKSLNERIALLEKEMNEVG